MAFHTAMDPGASNGAFYQPAGMLIKAPYNDPSLATVPVALRKAPAEQQSSSANSLANETTDALTPTIFHQPWWLNTVGGGSYEQVEVKNKGRVVGRLPYIVSRRHLFTVSTMPQLTHALGPAVDAGSGSINTQTLDRIEIMKGLAEQLPQMGLFTQVCHRSVTDVIGFQSCGFDATAHFSSEIRPAPEAQLWAAMRDKTRNVIRRSSERSQVEELKDPELFHDFYRRNLGGRASYFDTGLIAPLYEACRAHDSGRMLVTRDERGAPTAAIFYLWDQHTAWYFLSTRDRESKDNGAISQLLWHAIRHAASLGLTFDFDGVASEGSARFYAGFGGQVVPRYAIRRASAGFELMRSLATAVKGSSRNHFTDA